MSNRGTTVARTHSGTRNRRDSVPRELQLADAAAQREEHGEALAWLRTFEASGRRLDPVYQSKRATWRLKLEDERTGCSQWFG